MVGSFFDVDDAASPVAAVTRDHGALDASPVLPEARIKEDANVDASDRARVALSDSDAISDISDAELLLELVRGTTNVVELFTRLDIVVSGAVASTSEETVGEVRSEVVFVGVI